MCYGTGKSTATPAVKPPVTTTAVKVATSNPILATAQNLAVRLGKKSRFVNISQIHSELKNLGYNSADLGNAAGSVFLSKYFRATGDKVKNTNPSARGRKVGVWEYFGEGAPIVPGVNVGPATVTSVNVVEPKYVPATSSNTQSGSQVRIKKELQEKLCQGKRGPEAQVSEVVGSGKWPLRVKFSNGQIGLVSYEEIEVLQA